jgi:hypothetical protein
VAAAIEAGMCFVNSQNVRDLRQPFGGTKASGTGREGGTWSYEVFWSPRTSRCPWAATTFRIGELETMQRRHLVQAAAAAAVFPLAARAQAWPARPLRWWCPFRPAAPPTTSRLVAAELGKSLGQTVVVENRPVPARDRRGQRRQVGARRLQLRHRGQQLLRQPDAGEKLPYDSVRDLRPVALMGLSEHVLATHPAAA